MMRRVFLLLGRLALLVGCGRAIPTAVPLDSGGLERSLREWEARYGKTDDAHHSVSRVSPYTSIVVSDYVLDLQRDRDPGSEPTLEAARTEVRGVLPADTTLVSGSPDPEPLPIAGSDHRAIYRRASRATRFPAGAVGNPSATMPGDFTVWFTLAGARTTSAIFVQVRGRPRSTDTAREPTIGAPQAAPGEQARGAGIGRGTRGISWRCRSGRRSAGPGGDGGTRPAVQGMHRRAARPGPACVGPPRS